MAIAIYLCIYLSHLRAQSPRYTDLSLGSDSKTLSLQQRLLQWMQEGYVSYS